MKQETQVRTVSVANGTLGIFRVIDFDAIMANAVDGKISVEDLQRGGTFIVRYFPKKGDSKDFPLPSLDSVDGFVAGFEAMGSTVKRGGRKSTSPALPTDLKTLTRDYDFSSHNKAQIVEVAKAYGVEYKASMKKSEIAELIVAKLPAKGKRAQANA